MAKDNLQVLNALDAAKHSGNTSRQLRLLAWDSSPMLMTYLHIYPFVTKLLGRVYYHKQGSSKPGDLAANVSAAINGVAFCGTLAGQLFFGWLSDKMGRKRVYGMTLMLMVICSVASGLSFRKDAKSVMATICFFRFWLRFGIGGDYPLSATIMSEYANKKTRGAFIAAVFAMQGFGILAGGTVAMVVSSVFKVDPVGSTVTQADYVWRIILMLDALPAFLTYNWRLKMLDTLP